MQSRELHKQYKYKAFNELKIRHSELKNFINSVKEKLIVKQLGKSVENREIFLVKAGKGTKKILMWSQMHGNEPVSTMGLVDLLNFLSDKKNPYAQNLLNEVEIYAIPMLNPDGAEKFKRRNALNIDLNRDAIKQISPESQILNNIVDELKPNFAFNLHDQERYYGVKNTMHPTMISFLSPAFNFERSINDKRKSTMQIIAAISNMLKKEYADVVIGRYNDSFMPNAFGDFIQSKGIKTVLFEAGFKIQDLNRQYIRQVYFSALYDAIKLISNENFKNYSKEGYFEIPQNIKHNFSDFILRNVVLYKKGFKYKVDISIKKKIDDIEQFSDTIHYYIIDDIGDLSNKKAFKIVDFQNKVIDTSKIKIERLADATELMNIAKLKE